MRILFINTVDTSGGAAIVMQRLMKGLENTYNTESIVLVKEKKGVALNTSSVLTKGLQIAIEKIIDRLTRQTGLLYQYFPFSSGKIIQIARSFEPNVISLHNTQSGYFATPLIRKLSQISPVAWTLHDMWSFTGNPAQTFGNMSWRQMKNDHSLTRIPPAIGLNTGKWLLRQKKNIYSKSELTIITPSLWLKAMAEQSPVFYGKKIYHIYNGVDTTIYKPKNKQECKLKVGLPPGSKAIMFSAQDLDKNNPWKGGADLLTILSKINAITEKKIEFIAIGKSKGEGLGLFKNINVYYKGYIKDENEMSDYLNAADLFIYPTRADNLPNVLVEAIACSTPCITFNIGGTTEIIIQGVNGQVIEPFDFDKFAYEAVSLLEDANKLNQFSWGCQNIVRERFRLEIMVDKYYSLFQKIKK
jgi:glycosyltransferase involved in cell wall biosynthesis